VRIVRAPGSEGLLALNADGFLSDSVGVGPLLEDSEISFTGDDFLNIHNRMLVVCRQTSNNSLAIIDTSSPVVGKGTLGEVTTGGEMSFYKLQPNCIGGCKEAAHRIWTSRVHQCDPVTKDEKLLSECSEVYNKMQAPPYNASLVLKSLSKVVYHVEFDAPIPHAVVSTDYNLAQYDSRSSAHAVVNRNHFHDGYSRMGLLKATRLTYTNNIVERAGGVHVYEEQEWLEGDLGINGIFVANNTIIDPTTCGILRLTPAECLQRTDAFLSVMPGLRNITCVQNTFVSAGVTRPHSATCS